ncbi:hypothetical protein PQC39_gp045 [Vibrio phage Vp_R1]|uniref:Uncharacterized protein n=1 Tax=Vibrio phage Vp_R1 TaxID=2059867 RepID=A0A2H5BQ04_9CAUD|nr:hypothetical protein PQC39_gp045 [Vibrio phage Vp_R1]AUG88409.1 hypothetical protein VPR_045 [Vibrio phage Vp_R1]
MKYAIDKIIAATPAPANGFKPDGNPPKPNAHMVLTGIKIIADTTIMIAATSSNENIVNQK